jgi:hypothetical protein
MQTLSFCVRRHRRRTKLLNNSTDFNIAGSQRLVFFHLKAKVIGHGPW